MFHNDQSFKQEVIESIFQRARAVQKSLVIIAVTREEKKKRKKKWQKGKRRNKRPSERLQKMHGGFQDKE